MWPGKTLIAAWWIATLTAATAWNAAADMQLAQTTPAVTGTAAQPHLTFPPKSDCSFLGGPAQQQCEARRGAASQELAKVRSGEIKTLPPMQLPDNGLPSSGGGFTPFSNQGSLGGLSEGSTIAPSGDQAPPAPKSFDANSIGNPWAGTPYSNGTGIPLHK